MPSTHNRVAPGAALAALAGLALSGCAGIPFGPTSVGDPVAVVDPASVKIPWQLTPASTASEAQGEVTRVYDLPGHGPVRATAVAAALIDTPMTPFRDGGDRVVRACREVVERQARGIGAYDVDAGVAGPTRRTRSGRHATQVFFRIFYRRGDLTEVRQASLRCVVDRRGRLVGATPV